MLCWQKLLKPSLLSKKLSKPLKKDIFFNTISPIPILGLYHQLFLFIHPSPSIMDIFPPQIEF